MDIPRILIVEDERIVAFGLKSTLEGLDYAVAGTVPSGEEAITKAEEVRPDLVLMDINLEGQIDGVQAAEEIRTRFDIPVIYLTAFADSRTLGRAKVTEPYGYVLKPYREQELRTVIEVALYKHSMESKLRAHERWLSATLHSIGDAVIATDEKKNIVFMNAVAEMLTGWQEADAAQKPVGDIFRIVDEDSRRTVESPVDKVLATGDIVGLANHTLLIDRAGESHPIDDSAAPILNDQGAVVGVVLVFRDVAERRLAEQALIESEERYRQLLEQTEAALVQTEIYNEINRTMVSSIQLDQLLRSIVAAVRPVLAGSSVFLTLPDEGEFYLLEQGQKPQHIPPEQQSPAWQSLLAVVNAEDRPTQFSAATCPAPLQDVLQTLGGKELLVTPISYGGNRIGTLGALRARPRKFTLQELEIAQVVANQAAVAISNSLLHQQSEARAASLADSNEALEQFAYVASHDLQEPLRTIRSYTQLLQRRYENRLDPEADDFIWFILSGVDRMYNLINDLLAYSRVKTQQGSMEAVDLEAILQEVRQSMALTIAESSTVLTWDPLPTLRGNRRQLAQLLQNLISNAIKFRSRKSPRIHLGVVYNRGMWEFSFQDNGIGIAEEYQDRIFQIFQRLHTQDEYPGTGIGLAICRRIVEVHGGRMWVQANEESEGTTFLFTLPA